MKRYTVILCDNFRFADYHVLAEDNSVAVTRAISEHCWDDSEEKKRNGAQIADCNHKQFSFIKVGASMQKIKQAVSNQQPWVLGGISASKICFG